MRAPRQMRSSGSGVAGAGIWRRVWRKMSEIVSPAPTHWSEAHRCASRIDRAFVSSPPWMLTQMFVAANVVDEAEEIHRQGLSDHAMVVLAMNIKDDQPARSGPLHRSLFEDPLAARLAEELWD